MTTSLEDHAARVLSGKPGPCLCVEFAVLIQSQAEEIKRLKSEMEGMYAQLENLFNMG